MKNPAKLFLILTIFTASAAAQKVTFFVHDEASGQIKAVFFIDDIRQEGIADVLIR